MWRWSIATSARRCCWPRNKAEIRHRDPGMGCWELGHVGKLVDFFKENGRKCRTIGEHSMFRFAASWISDEHGKKKPIDIQPFLANDG